MRQTLTFLLIGAVLVLGSATSQARVAYADSEIFTIDTITSVDDPASSLPQATRLASIYPNPFNPSTTIAFDLARDNHVELAVFDVRGRLVSVLASGFVTAGRHQAIWYGTDRDGRSAPSGTYFCRLVAGQETQTMKLLLAK